MKSLRPKPSEVAETVRKLTSLRSQLVSEGAHFRAATVEAAIDLINRLAPAKGGGDGGLRQ
jgi:hypothetical protein